MASTDVPIMLKDTEVTGKRASKRRLAMEAGVEVRLDEICFTFRPSPLREVFSGGEAFSNLAGRTYRPMLFTTEPLFASTTRTILFPLWSYLANQTGA